MWLQLAHSGWFSAYVVASQVCAMCFLLFSLFFFFLVWCVTCYISRLAVDPLMPLLRCCAGCAPCCFALVWGPGWASSCFAVPPGFGLSLCLACCAGVALCSDCYGLVPILGSFCGCSAPAAWCWLLGRGVSWYAPAACFAGFVSLPLVVLVLGGLCSFVCGLGPCLWLWLPLCGGFVLFSGLVPFVRALPSCSS